MTGPKLTTLYCDDVRQEVSGKLIMIGVYQAHMFLDKMPFEFVGLNAMMMLSYPVSGRMESLSMQVYAGEEQVFNIDFDQQQLAENQEKALETKDESDRFFKIHMGARIDKIVFEEEITLTSKAIVNGEEVEGDSLNVKLFNA